jgi:phage N-6-adenine-methyltransferase
MAVLTATPSTTVESERDCWRTPPELFARLDAIYGQFDLDVAAQEHNALCPLYIGPGARGRHPLLPEDALTADWGLTRRDGCGPRVWCNPPYSQVARFVALARDHAARRRVRSVTLLLPATTDVRWWHDLVWDGAARRFRPGVEVDFLRRVKFLRPDGSAAGGPTFGSVVVTFRA